MNTQPLDSKAPTCPKHDTIMLPHTFQLQNMVIPRGVELFRCVNLSCSIFYATGALDGFYTRKPNGELMPYKA